MTRNALGRGLSALIREPEAPNSAPDSMPVPPPHITPPSAPSPAAATAAAVAPAREQSSSTGGVLQVDIDLIEPSPYQPRTRFAQAALEELAQSIRQTGIIQPLVVRRRGPRFQLLAGERRWRASQLIPLHRVPVVVQDVPDEKAVEITLVENLQREDLNPIEQAQAFERLMREFQLTQEEVAQRTGKERATIANSLRLLRLPQTIRDLVEEGKLSGGHARALLSLEDDALQLETARRAARGNLTVRQIERLARRSRKPATANESAAEDGLDANTRAALDELQRALGTKVSLTPCAPGHPGSLIVEYYTGADLDRLYRFILRDN